MSVRYSPGACGKLHSARRDLKKRVSPKYAKSVTSENLISVKEMIWFVGVLYLNVRKTFQGLIISSEVKFFNLKA